MNSDQIPKRVFAIFANAVVKPVSARLAPVPRIFPKLAAIAAL